MAALYQAMEELREMGVESVRCGHPRESRGLTEAGGTSLHYVCDPERGGCGADLGPVGGRG